MLTLHAVFQSFPARHRAAAVEALGPVDLAVEAQQFVAIVGPSGCGKSTLLRLIAGLAKPERGTVAIDGVPVQGRVAGCGMVFQQSALFPWLTVAGNIGFGLGRGGEGDRAAQVTQLLDLVGLTGFGDHYPAQLSGGMQQRAALARALAPGPELLLLDEPFGALDQQTRELMQELLETLWRAERRTMVLVTHDIEEALYLSDRVFVMSARPGKILASHAVPMARPRSPLMRTDPEFVQLKQHISATLRAEISAPHQPLA